MRGNGYFFTITQISYLGVRIFYDILNPLVKTVNTKETKITLA